VAQVQAAADERGIENVQYAPELWALQRGYQLLLRPAGDMCELNIGAVGLQPVVRPVSIFVKRYRARTGCRTKDCTGGVPNARARPRRRPKVK